MNKRKSQELKQLKLIQKIENTKLTIPTLLILFIVIILARFFLESISTKQPLDFLHIFTFYLATMLSISIILSIFTKTRIKKVANIVIPFFAITLLPPIIDLIISGGAGFKMLYLQPQNVSELVFCFITVGCGIEKGVSPGMKIELLIATLLIFYYIFRKTRSEKVAFLGAIASYTTIYFYGLSPLILKLILAPIGIQLIPNWENAHIIYFSILTIIQLILVFYLEKKK